MKNRNLLCKLSSLDIYGFFLIGMLAIANGCGSSNSDSQSGLNNDGNQNKNVESSVQRPSISDSDADALGAYSGLPKRWNDACAPLVRDYLDPNIPADQWVKEASSAIANLRAIQMEMHACTVATGNSELKNNLRESAANYRIKLDCLTALHNAVAQGDAEAEKQALRILSEASNNGQKIFQEHLKILGPSVNQEDLARGLHKSAKRVGELMKPQKASEGE